MRHSSNIPTIQAQGPRLRIHISGLPNQQATGSNEMDDIRTAARIANEADHENPPWSQQELPPDLHIENITQLAIDVYMLSKKRNGGMGGIGWWQAANGYTAMALHDLWSLGDPRGPHNYDTLSSIVRQCEARQPGLVNVFNDDTLWWAMLCMHMYAIKGDSWFLEKAKGIWNHVSKSVCRRGDVLFEGRDMEGAVYWTTKPGEEQINAISTGLFAELSVRLALVQLGNKAPEGVPQTDNFETSTSDYIEAARCSLGWILRCRYRPRQGIVLDNIMLKRGKARDWIFTYNTGVALGVCALLYEATREEDYMTLAYHMTVKAMTRVGPKGWVEDNGVLTEKGAYGRGTHDPYKNNNSVGFKAVLVRQLCTLYNVLSRTKSPLGKPREVKNMIRRFVNINFRSQLERNTSGNGQYGPWWNGPFECPTSHSQMAVLDVMAAVVLVNRH